MVLEQLFKQMYVLEGVIKELRFSMRHASPATVNALRLQIEELEAVFNELMESCVVSNFDLESILTEHEECLKDCFRPVYTGEPVVLPKPKWDVQPEPDPEPPVATVPGVNLILYIDSTGSMKGALGGAGRLRRELEQFANYLKSESDRANIPCTVSLIWYGDRTDQGGDGANYYSITMNKENVSEFPNKISRPVWYFGGMKLPESGILCMKETLASVIKPGVANTLIYISDAPAKIDELGATPNQVKTLFTNNQVKAYGIYPTNKEPDISNLFVDTRQYGIMPYNILPWADSTLRP